MSIRFLLYNYVSLVYIAAFGSSQVICSTTKATWESGTTNSNGEYVVAFTCTIIGTHTLWITQTRNRRIIISWNNPIRGTYYEEKFETLKTSQ